MELSSRLGHPADGHLLVLLHQGLVVVLLIPFSVFYSGPTSVRTNRRQPTLGSENLLLSVSDFSTERVSGWDGRVPLQSATHGPPRTSHLHCLEDPNVVAVAAGSGVVPPSLVLVSFRQWLGPCPSVGLRGVVLLGAASQFWRELAAEWSVRCARLFFDDLGVVHNLGTSLCLSL